MCGDVVLVEVLATTEKVVQHKARGHSSSHQRSGPHVQSYHPTVRAYDHDGCREEKINLFLT